MGRFSRSLYVGRITENAGFGAMTTAAVLHGAAGGRWGRGRERALRAGYEGWLQ